MRLSLFLILIPLFLAMSVVPSTHRIGCGTQAHIEDRDGSDPDIGDGYENGGNSEDTTWGDIKTNW